MPPPAHTPLAPPRAAPPPPTLPDQLLHLVASLANRLNHLESHQLPQLAQANDRAWHDQLASDARRELSAVKRDVEELKLQVDDLQKSRDRRAGAEHVVSIQLRLDSITKLYRQSVIASSRLMEAQQASAGFTSARDELFSSANRAGTPNGASASGKGGKHDAAGVLKKGGGDGGDDALMSATSDVTEGLRRTLQLMQQEVDRSAVSNELLESQTATLSLTSEQYSLLSTLLTTSKALITSLARADLLDRLLLAAALLLFGLCCAWVVKRRVVDRGLKIAGALSGAVGRAGGGVVKRGMSDGGEAVAVTTAVLSAVQAARTVVAGAGGGGDGRAERAKKAQERIREEQERERRELEEVEREVESRKAAPVNTPEPVEEGGGLALEDMLEEGAEEELELVEDDEFEEEEDEQEEEQQPILSTTPVLPTEGASTFTDEDGVIWDMVPPSPSHSHSADDLPPPPPATSSSIQQEIPSEYPSATDPAAHAQDEASPVVTSSSVEAQPTPASVGGGNEESGEASAEPEFETPTPAETLLATAVESQEEEQKPTATPEPEPESPVEQEQEQEEEESIPSPSPSPSPSPVVVVAESESPEDEERHPLASTTIEEPLSTAAADVTVEPPLSLLTSEVPTLVAEPTPSPSTTLDQPESQPTEPTDADLGLDSHLGFGGQPIISVFRNATPTASAEMETVEEAVFTPLERFRPATPEVADRNELIEEHWVEEQEQEHEGEEESELEKRDGIVEEVEEPVVQSEVEVEEPSATPSPSSTIVDASPAAPTPTPTSIDTEPEPEPELAEDHAATTFTDSDGTIWDIVPGGVLPPGAILEDDGRPKDLNPASRKGGYQGFEMLRDYEPAQPSEEEEEWEEEEEGEWEDYDEEYELEEEVEPALPEPATNVGSMRSSAVVGEEQAPVETAAAPAPIPEAAITVEEVEVQASQTPAPVAQAEVVQEQEQEQQTEQEEEEEVPTPIPSPTIEEPIVPAPLEPEEPVAEPLPISSAVIEEPTPSPSPSPSSSSEPIPEPIATVDSTIASPSPSTVDEPLVEPISPPPTDDDDEQVWSAVPGGEGKYTKDDVFYPEEGGITAREKEAMEKAARAEKQRQERSRKPLDVEREVPEVVQRAVEGELEEDVLEGTGEVERGTESAELEMEGSVELPVEELVKAGIEVEKPQQEEITASIPSSAPIVAPSSTVDPLPAATPTPSAEPILPPSDEDEDESTTFEDILTTPDDEDDNDEDDISASAIDVEEGEDLPLESDEYLGELEDEVEESEGEGKVFRDEL